MPTLTEHEIRLKLQRALDDPMWPQHAEVSKDLLRGLAGLLHQLQAQALVAPPSQSSGECFFGLNQYVHGRDCTIQDLQGQIQPDGTALYKVRVKPSSVAMTDAAISAAMSEGRRMTEEEYLLGCLAEECGELCQAAMKCLRFGLQERHPDPSKGLDDNKTYLLREFYDVIGVVYTLMTVGSLEYSQQDMENGAIAKEQKLEMYLGFAKDQGIIRTDHSDRKAAILSVLDRAGPLESKDWLLRELLKALEY